MLLACICSVIIITLYITIHFLSILKCTLFETTKKGLINSPEMYGHPFTERPSIYVCFLTPPP